MLARPTRYFCEQDGHMATTSSLIHHRRSNGRPAGRVYSTIQKESADFRRTNHTTRNYRTTRKPGQHRRDSRQAVVVTTGDSASSPHHCRLDSVDRHQATDHPLRRAAGLTSAPLDPYGMRCARFAAATDKRTGLGVAIALRHGCAEQSGRAWGLGLRSRAHSIAVIFAAGAPPLD